MNVIKALFIAAALAVASIAKMASAATILVEDQKIDGRTYIVILGEIEQNDLVKFAEASSSIDDAVVVFNGVSRPGSKADLFAAMKIGELIQKNGYDTAILRDEKCGSVCSLVWISGKNRWISESATLGFGNYLNSETSVSELPEIFAMVGYYMAGMGIPSKSIVPLTKWRGGSHISLCHKDLSQFGISAEVLSATWIENVMYPNGPLPPPPVTFGRTADCGN